MRKFIMKEGKGVRYGYFQEGITYNENHKVSAGTKLIDIVEEYPEDWEEVFEEKSSPEQYYAGDTNTLSISGTFGDVVFSLSGNFEKCLTILDFISTLDIKK